MTDKELSIDCAIEAFKKYLKNFDTEINIDDNNNIKIHFKLLNKYHYFNVEIINTTLDKFNQKLACNNDNPNNYTYSFFSFNYPCKEPQDIYEKLLKYDESVSDILQLIYMGKKSLNKVDVKNLEKKLNTTRAYEEYLIYLGESKYIEFSNTDKYIQSAFCKYVTYVVYFKSLKAELNNYKNIRINEKIYYINNLRSIYYTDIIKYDSDEEVENRFVGSNFNNYIYKAFNNIFGNSELFDELLNDATTMYYYISDKKMTKLNYSMFILAISSLVIALCSIVMQILS